MAVLGITRVIERFALTKGKYKGILTMKKILILDANGISLVNKITQNPSLSSLSELYNLVETYFIYTRL